MSDVRLFFDARYIRTDFHDGISRFSAELAAAVSALAATDGGEVEVTYLIHDRDQRRLLPDGAATLQIHAPTSAKEPFTALLLNRHRPDVVFSPMQTIGSLGRKFRLILTLHDTIYYRHRTPPRDLPALVRLGWRLFHLTYAPQRMVLNQADIVATVSETSKRQFAEVRLTKRPVIVLGNAPQRLGELLAAEEGVDHADGAVVGDPAASAASAPEGVDHADGAVVGDPAASAASAPEGVAASLDADLPDTALPEAALVDVPLPDATLPYATMPEATLPDASSPAAPAAGPALAKAGLPPRNIVYMGSFMPYKNVETLVRAMAWLPEHTLHLLSRISPDRKSELEALAPSGSSIVFHGGVSDAQYAALLADRAVLATLSLDEGYGLPIAEALAFGVPAVVSDLEIFREVAGEGALFVASRDARAVARAVQSLDDDQLRARVVSSGIQHANGYSWERTAHTLITQVRQLAAQA